MAGGEKKRIYVIEFVSLDKNLFAGKSEGANGGGGTHVIKRKPILNCIDFYIVFFRMVEWAISM